jgi:hypothetical protein
LALDVRLFVVTFVVFHVVMLELMLEVLVDVLIEVLAMLLCGSHCGAGKDHEQKGGGDQLLHPRKLTRDEGPQIALHQSCAARCRHAMELA